MDPLLRAGLVVAIGALLVLGYGVWKANPLVSFGTVEEVGAQSAGRTLVYAASVALALTAVALLGRLSPVMAFAVAEPGIVCSLIVALWPQTAFALIAFVVCAPLAPLTLLVRMYRWAGG